MLKGNNKPEQLRRCQGILQDSGFLTNVESFSLHTVQSKNPPPTTNKQKLATKTPHTYIHTYIHSSARLKNTTKKEQRKYKKRDKRDKRERERERERAKERPIPRKEQEKTPESEMQRWKCPPRTSSHRSSPSPGAVPVPVPVVMLLL